MKLTQGDGERGGSGIAFRRGVRLRLQSLRPKIQFTMCFGEPPHSFYLGIV